MKRAKCSGVALLLAGLTTIVAACAAPVSGPEPNEAAAPMAPSVAPTRSLSETHPEVGSAEATIGQTYPFDLYVHCGGEFVHFAGLDWRTRTPPGPERPSPDANGVVTVTGYLAGWITRTSADTVEFRPAGSPDVVLYTLTSEVPPVCA